MADQLKIVSEGVKDANVKLAKITKALQEMKETHIRDFRRVFVWLVEKIIQWKP